MMSNFFKVTKSIGFSVIMILVLLISVIPAAYAADSGVSITQAPGITLEDDEFEFDISVNVTPDTSANIVVATYDKDKNMLNASIERLNSYGKTIVSVMSDTTVASYKMFVFDRNAELKPLCPAYPGTLNYSDFALRGMVDEVYNAGDSFYCVINGIEYVSDVELEVGDYGVYYKTPSGEIYRFEAIDIRDKGYILEASMGETTFSGSTLKVKLLTADNTIEEYDVGGNGTDNLIEHLGLTKSNPDLSFVNNADYLKRFIAYNPVSSTQFNSYEATGASVQEITGAYSAAENSIGEYTFKGIMPVFCIGNSDVSEAEAMNITDLTDGQQYSGQLLFDADGVAVAFILQEGEYTAPEAEVTTEQIYVLGLASSGLTDDLWQVRYVSKNGVDTKNVRSAIADEFLEYLGADAGFSYDNTVIDENRLLNVSITGNRIVDVESTGDTLSALNGTYSGGKIGDVSIASDAVVYDMTSDSYESVCASDNDYLTEGTQYRGYISADSDVYIITKSTYCIAAENNIAIVTSNSAIVDEGQYASYASSVNGNWYGISGGTMNTSPRIPYVQRLEYVQDETQKSAIFSNNTQLVSSTVSETNSLKKGDVVQIVEDSNGVIQYCAVIGTIETNGLLNYDSEIVKEINFEDTTEYMYGYIANEKKFITNKGEILDLNCGGADSETVVVRAATNKYTYNDAGRIIEIETEDFMAEDAYYLEVTDEENGKAEVTYVLLKITDDDVTDIYSFNHRVEIDWNNQ